MVVIITLERAECQTRLSDKCDEYICQRYMYSESEYNILIRSEVLISEVQQRTENVWREMEAKVKLSMVKLIEEFSENVVNVYEDLE